MVSEGGSVEGGGEQLTDLASILPCQGSGGRLMTWSTFSNTGESMSDWLSDDRGMRGCIRGK